MSAHWDHAVDMSAGEAPSRVNVLGPIELIVDGQAAHFTSPRLRHLLAVLVAHANTVISTDRLVDVIWPGEDEASALRTLRTNVWRLRSLMGAEADRMLLTRQGGYVLALGDDDLDAERFEVIAALGATQLVSGDAAAALATFDEALGLWRGRAFEGYETEEWARPTAVRLENIRATVAERRVEALLAVGRGDEAIADLARLVAEDPLRERLQLLYMRALYRNQRQAEALRVYAEYRSLLAEELGVEPSPELRNLEQSILQHDLAAVGGTTPVLIARGYELAEAVSTTPVTVTYRATAPRTAEHVLLTVIDRAVACDPSYVRVFEVESQRMRSVVHEHLVAVTDCWRDGDGAYFVTPPALKASPFVGSSIDTASFVRVVEQAVAAIHHLHVNGLAHGRLGAGAIHLDPDDRVTVWPGGLAAGLRGASASTDQRDLAMWLGSIAPPDLGPRARAAIERGCSQRDEQFDSMQEFGDALIQAATGATGATGAATPFDVVRNPYVGLRSFQESDADVFFGRDRLIKEMLTRLGETSVRSRLLAVVGASGSGKSSAVRAGLVPALRRGGVDGSVDWFVAAMAPGDDPFASCRSALEAVAVRPLDAFDELRAQGGNVLAQCARESLPHGATLLVIVDQFEELFSSSVDPAACGAFLDVIAEVATDPEGPVRIVLTLRADFYDRPLQHPRFGQLLNECQVVATALTGDDMSTVIEGPADLVGLSFEPGLVRALVSDFEINPSLPLLQHALAELCDRRDGDRLTLHAYDTIGGLAGGVAHRAETLYGEFPVDQRPLVRRLLTRLVALGDGTVDTRRRVQRRELDGLAGSTVAVDTVLERFGTARLVTFDHDRTSRQPTVEIAHEALIVRWERLAAWVDEDREGLLLVRHLSSAAQAWADRGRDPAELYRGARLESISAWAAQHQRDLGSIESEFLQASQQQAARETDERAAHAEQQHRQHRRLRWLSATASCAAVVALIAGGVAIVQARRADDRRAEALTAQGAAAEQAELADEQRGVAVDAQTVAEAAREDADAARMRSDVDRLVAQVIADAGETPARSLLLAAAAYDLDPSASTAGAMQSAIVAQPAGFIGFIPSGESGEVQIGPSVIARHTLASVEIVDRASRAVRLVIPDPTDNTRFALSVDDRLVALAGPTIRIFDAVDGSLLADLERATSAIDVDFDPSDASRLAIGFDDGTTEIVEWRSDTTTARLEQQGDLVRTVSFSPDGRYVATATGSRESALRIWDSSTGLPTTGNLGSAGTVLYHADLAFDSTGTRLASVDRGGVGRVWSVPAGELISRTEKTYGVESLYSLEFESEDVIIASGPSGLLRRWSASDGADLDSIEPHAGLVASIAIDPARRVLLVGGSEHLALFDLSGSAPGRSVDPYPPEMAAVLPEGSAVPTAISRDGQTVAALTSGGVWVWDRSKGSAGARPVPSASPGIAFSVTLSPDGTVLVVPHLDYARGLTEIVVFDVATLAVTHRIEAQRGSLVTISPDNRWLAFASISYPRSPTLEVVDLTTGARSSLVDELTAVTEDIDPLRGAWVSSMSFSPDSRLLAAANHRGAAMIWDLSTLKPVGDPLSRGNDEVVDLEFGDSSDVIVSVSSSNDISVRDVATRELFAPLMQSPSGLSIGLAVSPDGTKLLSGGSDGVRLWEVTDGVAIGRPYPVSTPLGPTMQWLADSDSFTVVTDLGVETWTTDPPQWRAHLCELAGRSLTDDEWARFGTDSPTPRC